MKFRDFHAINESPAFKPNAMSIQGQPRPSVTTANVATDLYNLYIKIGSKATSVTDDMKPTWSNAANHVFLAYEAIRKQYPSFFRKLD